MKVTPCEKLFSTVRTPTVTVAAGAIAKAQIAMRIKTTKPIPQPIEIFLCSFIQSINLFPDADFLSELRFFFSAFSPLSEFSSPASSSSTFSAFSSSSESSSADSTVISFTITFSALSLPLASITSSLVTASVSDSSSNFGITGADCRFLVTGNLVTAANLMMDGSVVTSTIVFSAFMPALVINFMFTMLRNTPAFLGGTNATIFSFEFSILVMISVISSSGSI